MKINWDRVLIALPLFILAIGMTISNYQKDRIIKQYEEICLKYQEMFLGPVAEVSTSKKMIYFRLPASMNDTDFLKLYSIRVARAEDIAGDELSGVEEK